MAQIYTIQASDAPQHTAKLQQTLQNLKSENRIDSFNTLGSDSDLSSLTDTFHEDDLILVVLTNQLEPKKEQIESTLQSVNARVAEIIVDHVVYDNAFITFPADLRPIRDREDMDEVWNGIEQSLRDMFPAKKEPEPVPPTPIDWSKYLKIAGVIVGILLILFLIKMWSDGDEPTAERVPVEVEEARPAEVEEARPLEIEMTSGRFVVNQTWFGDFDLGREVPRGAPRSEADFWFEARTATDRAIVPRNNAQLSIMSGVSNPTFDQIRRMIERGGVSEINVRQLTPGLWVAVRTSDGNYAAFTLESRVGPSPGELRIRYMYWKE